MPTVSRARFVPTAIFLLLASFGLSGCASAILGVGTAAVAASTTEKGFSTSVADTQIHAKLTDQFIKTNYSLVTAVDVSVNDGAVLLTGKVKTPEEKMLATKLTWEIRGVREVVNELQVTDSSSIKQFAQDGAASGILRARLMADSNISSLNFSIDVVNGTIYLSGVAANADEMNRVVAHSRDVRYTQKVVNYIILQTDKRL
jgi:osmotically-inducible protein OsmY